MGVYQVNGGSPVQGMHSPGYCLQNACASGGQSNVSGRPIIFAPLARTHARVGGPAIKGTDCDRPGSNVELPHRFNRFRDKATLCRVLDGREKWRNRQSLHSMHQGRFSRGPWNRVCNAQAAYLASLGLATSQNVRSHWLTIVPQSNRTLCFRPARPRVCLRSASSSRIRKNENSSSLDRAWYPVMPCNTVSG
jgi:hypothetical protein